MVFGSPLSNEPSIKKNENSSTFLIINEIGEGDEEKDKEGQYPHISGLRDGDHQ